MTEIGLRDVYGNGLAFDAFADGALVGSAVRVSPGRWVFEVGGRTRFCRRRRSAVRGLARAAHRFITGHNPGSPPRPLTRALRSGNPAKRHAAMEKLAGEL